MRTGLEILLSKSREWLSGRRVGLVSHPAAVLPDLTGVLDALQTAGGYLAALFGPEHGFSGATVDGARVAHGRDVRSGLPVYSLYGDQHEPTAEMLADLDVLVYDMQDVGVRFYTYLSTLYYVLRGAGKFGKPVIVLDRPNPITGEIVEGPILKPGYESFVGVAPLPIRHGLTMGELACYMNVRHNLGVSLEVVTMQGWKRGLWFDQTGLPWVLTSPAMPHLSTAVVYPGMCLMEGTNLSEGRGTALPFEICGAPWLDGYALAQRLNNAEHSALAGVRFRPLQFKPFASKCAGEVCEGVQVHVLDRQVFRPVQMVLYLLATIKSLDPEKLTFSKAGFDRLMGNSKAREALESGKEKAGDLVDQLFDGWQAELSVFDESRRSYWLYGN